MSGKRYRLPAELGGGELEAAGIRDYAADFIIGDCMVTIPIKLLLEVPPPIPDEPDPGAYLIGDKPCWHDEAFGWWVGYEARTIWKPIWHEWNDVWAMVGGPDVSIVSLMPEAEIDEAAVERAARVLYNLERRNGTDWWAHATTQERAPQLVKAEAALRAATEVRDDT